MSNWKKFQLKELIKTNEYTYSLKEGWKFVNYLDTGNITKNKIEEIQYIDLNTDKLPSRARRKVQENNIIYSSVRPNQLHYGIIKSQPENFLVSTGFTVIEVDTEKALPDFIYYLLTQKEITEHLHAIGEQSVSTYPSIKPSNIEDLEVSMPNITEQQKIVSILSTIDNKINVNNAINDNLEQQAFAIFNNMFPNVSIGNNLIGDLITPQRGKNLLSKDAIPGKIPVVAGGLEPATYHNQSNTISPVLTISASGANAGFVNLWDTPVWSSDSSFIDSSMTNDVYFWYAMLKIRQQEIFDAQTGSAQPHIYPKHIAAMPVIDLNTDNITAFTNIVTPLFQTIGKNKQENIKLADIRDILLPKLMSGALDVSNVEL